MELANAMVALGGDRGNTVPKTGITAAEIAVLMAIHGNDAVFDIEPAGSDERSNRDELSRLRALYGSAKNEDNDAHVDLLYPGAGARVHESIADLGLNESLFKPTQRATPGGPTADTAPTTVSRASGFQPTQVPNEEGRMVDPTTQPRVNLPPGVATNTVAGQPAMADELAERATAQPGEQISTPTVGADPGVKEEQARQGFANQDFEPSEPEADDPLPEPEPAPKRRGGRSSDFME